MNQSLINRRRLMQQLASFSLGAALLPSFGFAEHPIPEDPTSIYIPPGGGIHGMVGDMQITFKLNKNQTSNHLASWESTIQPGELGAPPHYHTSFDEICRVLEGTVFIMTGNEVTEVKAGGWHLRPKGVVHTFWNSGSVPAKTIDLCIPGGHEDYMQELAALFENNKRPKPDDFKLLEQKHDIHYRFDLLKEVMQKYNVKL
ncbi:cupin domain-containing protein [Lacibacter cauensis]|nr:cupin domain-containing protein [Lacibacter cauensis]